MKISKSIGILAFQGGVVEHKNILQTLGIQSIEVRSLQDLTKCDALIMPGGESTTIGFFLEESGLMKAIKARVLKGMPVWGTCAGAILLAKHIISDKIPPHLKLMNITVERNAYGRQLNSFYADINIPKLKIQKLHAAFIRAPIIHKAGPKVEILATHENRIILAQEGNLLASTFHPELRTETRLHEYFLSMIG